MTRLLTAKAIKKGLFCALALFSSSIAALPAANFSQAKKIALEIFSAHPETLYCGCRYDADKRIDLASCNMQTASHIKRAHRLEFEHLVAAENLGRHFACWREKLCYNKRTHKPFKGRKCCQKIDANFRHAESELYNLWPAVGLINALRSNYRFAALTDKTKTFGCDMVINKQSRRVEPPGRAKGVVARANLFMADKYHISLSKAQRQLFMAWDKTFPPNPWEYLWAQKVAQVEGYSNPYIDNHKIPQGSKQNNKLPN